MERKLKSFGARRTFLRATAATGASILTGGFGSTLSRAAAAAKPGDPIWIERTIPELQALMGSGALTSRELTRGYIQRIAQFNPLLRAVIETNPRAEAIAAQRDNERRQGRGLRGPLHGIPILVKDNIATDDQMQTTAGSLALVNSKVPADAKVIERLRAAGAVILGKANLGEWANFRGFNPLGFYGWTARGGPTHNPYLLDHTALGSSSGSAVGVVANLCAAAVGTETDGSIVGPCECESGRRTQADARVDFAGRDHSDQPQPGHGRSDRPYGHRRCGDARRAAVSVRSVAGQPLPTGYTQFLQRGALDGARIGVDQRYFDRLRLLRISGGRRHASVRLQALARHGKLGRDSRSDRHRRLYRFLR